MTSKDLHTTFLSSSGICTDTRTLASGNIYFALKGENFNGNTFAQKAIDQGATLAVIDEERYGGEHTLLVTNVLDTLQELASYHREYLNIPIIGLTGSNGKTTTKELINAVLSTTFKTTATIGNLNNHIGVPLTLLSMTSETEIGIVEMGANHQKEIAMLSQIAKPNYGYITNFGKAHLEGFGGMAGVIKGKSELYDHLRNHQGIAFINDQDQTQLKQAKGLKHISFGSLKSLYPITFTNAQPNVSLAFGAYTIESQLIGSYNFSNIAAAIAIGKHFKVSNENIKKGIENYLPENNRSQIIKTSNFSIILDAYNANPTSMAAALENLSLQKNGATVAFIGDMFEVGDTKLEEHQEILNLADRLSIDQVYAVGPSFGSSKVLSENQKMYGDYDAFAKAYSHKIPNNATVLIKGSRGMKMERVLELIKR